MYANVYKWEITESEETKREESKSRESEWERRAKGNQTCSNNVNKFV